MNLMARERAFVMRVSRVALYALIVLAGSGAFAQKVHVQFEKGVDFSRFRTYAWLESKHPADRLWAQRVVAITDGQLTRKGLKRVDPLMSPDLEIRYNSGIKTRTVAEGCAYGCMYAEYLYSQIYGPLWFWPMGPGSWVSEVEKDGSLIVDLVDASNNEMVWRGVATAVLSDKTKNNERKLNKAIRKMFKKYPQTKFRRCKGAVQ